MPHYKEEIYSKVTLNCIDEINFLEFMKIIKKDINIKKFVNFTYTDRTLGIYYNNLLVGLINGITFIEGNVALNIYILNDYRGKGIAQVATEKMVYEKGYLYEESKQIIANVLPSNESALKAIKSLGWKQTNEFDELMIDEGSDFYNIYTIDNPYHIKKVLKNDRK